MKMPPLNMDEVLLLIDTYNNIRKTKNAATKTSFYRELSSLLRSLPFYPEFKDRPQFRSDSAVEIMLNNIFYSETQREGAWTRLTQRQVQVIEYYKNDKYLLHDIGATIRSIKKSDINMPLYEAADEFMGGTMLYSFHRYIEEKGEQARLFAEDFKGETVCHICGEDMSRHYGAQAEKMMSVHYAAPISWYPSALQVSSAEYMLLCPACHKFAHTEVRFLEGDALYKAINK